MRPKLELCAKEDIALLKKGVTLLLKYKLPMKKEMRLITLYHRLKNTNG